MAAQINIAFSGLGAGCLCWLIFAGFSAPKPNLPNRIYPLSNKQASDSPKKIYDLVETPSGGFLFDDWAKGQIGILDDAAKPAKLSGAILHEPERLGISQNGRFFVSARGDHIQEGLYEIQNDLSGARMLMRYPAVDMEIDSYRNLIILVNERRPEIALFDLDSNAHCVYKPPKFFPPYAAAIDSRRGTCFVSGWYFGSHLIYAQISAEKTLLNFRSKLVGPFSMGMAVDESNDRLYLARPLIGKIDVFRLPDLKRIKRIDAPMWLREIAVNDRGDLIFATNYLTGETAVIRSMDGLRCASYQAGTRARSVVYSKKLDAALIVAPTQINALPISALPEKCLIK